MTIATINPATGRTERTFQPLSDAELDSRIQCAADTYRRYRRLALPERTRMLIKAAEILEAEKEVFGRLMTLEMGKTLKAAVDEAVKCALGCRYYAQHAVEFPFLASLSLRSTGACRGQCRPAEACVQRAAMRSCHRRHLPSRRLS